MVEDIAAFARDIGLAPLRLILSGEATVLYAAPSPDECDDRLEPHAWVHRITVERGKTKMLEKPALGTPSPPQRLGNHVARVGGGCGMVPTPH